MRFTLILLFIFSFSTLWGEIGTIKLITPIPSTIYHEETASVVVTFISPTIDGIIISAESNQSSKIFRQKERSSYCKTVQLVPGENRITVSGFGKDGIIENISVLIFHDIVSEKIYKYPPEKYVEESFHTPVNEQFCSSCHKMEVNETPGIAFENPSDSNCFQCHQKLTTRKYGHAPAINWLCTSCHEVKKELNDAKFTLPSRIGKTCLKCHDKESQKWEAKRFHHMPVDSERCTRCHNPHSSENKFYLKAKPWDICTSCHLDKREGKHVINTFGNKNHPTRGKPDPSRPGKEIECISCHNPHASDSVSLIDAKSPMSICVKCHKK